LSAASHATVKRFYYEAHNELRVHLADFVTAYNFAKRLKTLKGLTPYEYICKVWTKEPERFSLNPLQQVPGLNISRSRCGRKPDRRVDGRFPGTRSRPRAPRRSLAI
jgi:hypothetical protein